MAKKKLYRTWQAFLLRLLLQNNCQFYIASFFFVPQTELWESSYLVKFLFMWLFSHIRHVHQVNDDKDVIQNLTSLFAEITIAKQLSILHQLHLFFPPRTLGVNILVRFFCICNRLIIFRLWVKVLVGEDYGKECRWMKWQGRKMVETINGRRQKRKLG